MWGSQSTATQANTRGWWEELARDGSQPWVGDCVSSNGSSTRPPDVAAAVGEQQLCRAVRQQTGYARAGAFERATSAASI